MAILDGTNQTADQKLMDDVMNAPDAYDGGCPADVADAANALTVKSSDIIDRAIRIGIERGLLSAERALIDCNMIASANVVRDATPRILAGE